MYAAHSTLCLTFHLASAHNKCSRRFFKDGGWAVCIPKPMAEIVRGGFCSYAESDGVDDDHPRKPGRPRKWPKPVGDFVGPRRPVGRPRKHHDSTPL